MSASCPHAPRVREPGCECTYEISGNAQPNPHTSMPRKPKQKILDSVLDHIGETPLIRCSRLAASEGLECDLLAKCEFFSAGGSVKDRIGKRMILDAEVQGRIKKGDTLIEPTSGNTGIGLALTAALRGYRMIITLPEKMSKEKVDVLKALGAEIIRTPTEAAFDSPDSHIGVAERLQREIPNSHILDQYANPSNPMAHYEGTAEEIWEQCEGKIDMLVMTAGTGGTITGTARRLKELNPELIVVGVDPIGSILAQPPSLNTAGVGSYLVEGIGYDFIPKVLDRTVVDRWMKSEDRTSFHMARRLIREEGLLCGGSAGAAMAAAVEAARTLGAGKRVVVLLADSVRNYMSKFLSDPWMHENGFLDEYNVHEKTRNSWWANSRIADLELHTPITVTPDVPCREAISLMSVHNFDMVPVQAEDGKVLGVVTEGNLTSFLTQGRCKPEDPCVKAMFKQFRKVSLNTKLSDLAVIFDRDPFALVVSEQQCFTKDNEFVTRSVVSGVVTRIDLLNFISKGSS